MKLTDLSGRTFGKWLVLRKTSHSGTHTKWECKCECGELRTVFAEALVRGQSKSCGCFLQETMRLRIVHGMSREKKSKEYRSWDSAKGRCYRPTDINFKNYGARGIVMCDSWKNDFREFFKYMGVCPKGKTLDRIEVNGNYEPGNCVWSDRVTQANNKTSTIWVEWKSALISLAELCRREGLVYNSAYKLHNQFGTDVGRIVSGSRKMATA